MNCRSKMVEFGLLQDHNKVHRITVRHSIFAYLSLKFHVAINSWQENQQLSLEGE